jgi:hypothetical protein
MSTTRFAAIQMVSAPDVALNLVAAGRLVAQAAEGCPNSSACSAAATPTS